MFFDPFYLLVVALPAMILISMASSKVKSTYAKYSKEANSSGLTGAEAARKLLDHEGLMNVPIEIVAGSLSDHYDPMKKVLRLSREVAYSNSISALGVAAHETGHAVQHAHGYVPLTFRNAILPAASFGSQIGPWMVMIGVMIRFTGMIQLGIWLFGAALVFQVITLPVELDASNRALVMLDRRGFLSDIESIKAREVLKAAAMTYVASAAVAALQFFYYLSLGNRRR